MLGFLSRWGVSSLTSLLSLTLAWLAGIAVISERVVSDLTTVSSPGVAVVIVGVSPRRAANVWDPLCAVGAPQLPDFVGLPLRWSVPSPSSSPSPPASWLQTCPSGCNGSVTLAPLKWTQHVEPSHGEVIHLIQKRNVRSSALSLVVSHFCYARTNLFLE